MKRTSSVVDDFIKDEYIKFFETADRERKEVITGLFNAGSYWHLIQVDKKGSKLLRKNIEGQILFLDTNIIYGISGLHGNTYFRSLTKALSDAKELGYILAVTNKTIEEFHNSIKGQMAEISRRVIPADITKTAMELLGCEDPISIYW